MGLPCPYLFYSVYSKPSRGFQSHFRHLIVICRDRCHFGYLPVSVVFTGIPVDLDIFPKVQVDLCACVLSNSMDYSLLGSSVHGISQARILERVSISSSRGSSQPRDQTLISYVSYIAGGFFFFLPSEPPGKPHVDLSAPQIIYLSQVY